MRLIVHHYFNEKREAGKRDSLSESRLPTSHSLLFNNVTPFQEMENYNVSPFQELLQCYSILENGNFTIAVALVASLLATGYGNNLINKLLYQLLHVGAFYQGACVEVNPVWLVLSQITVG